MIDSSWLDKQKKEHKLEANPDTAPFVSSNDILTSWIARGTKSTHCMMQINLRGRVCGLNDSHAGNYEYSTVYDKTDFASPAGIRASLSRMHVGMTSDPTLMQKLRPNWCLVTNWASLYEHLSFAGCEQIVHLPLMSPPQMRAGFSMGVIFQAKEKQLGVVMMAANEAKLHDLLTSNVILA